MRLHGKGGSGAASFDETDASGTDVVVIAPTGNADGWGARQWLYFPDDEYASARTIVDDAVAGCEQVIVNGFSNGAAFAAALYCRGETFDERLVGVVIDDPVVDHAVDECSPDPDVDVTLYWTGALEAQSQPGTDCADADWTCDGGTTIGLDAYAAALGTAPLESPFSDHEWYTDAPELSRSVRAAVPRTFVQSPCVRVTAITAPRRHRQGLDRVPRPAQQAPPAPLRRGRPLDAGDVRPPRDRQRGPHRAGLADPADV